MSNPLIRPNDPRFQRLPVRDESGKNRFSEEQAPPAEAAAEAPDLFASPQPGGGPEPAYKPEYISRQPSRQRPMLLLAAISLSSDAAGAIAIWREQWTLCAIALFAGAVLGGVSWYLATDEFAHLKAGVLDEEHRSSAWAGVILASLGVLLALALAAGAVYSAILTAL
jgi:hypothetical protein